MKVIKNPLSDHLDPECLKIGTSTKARLVNINEFVKELSPNKPILFSVGAVSHGNPGMENDYVTDSICISKFSLSASVALSKLCNAFENHWNVEQF
jgi:rRNA small subunit pseudouridine methyltransferase Nep1